MTTTSSHEGDAKFCDSLAEYALLIARVLKPLVEDRQ